MFPTNSRLSWFLSLALASLHFATAHEAQDRISPHVGGVAAAGDVDRDGKPDFALAWRDPELWGLDQPSVLGGPGKVWIVSGANGQVIRALEPVRAAPDFGRQLVNAGDLDADGYEELAIAGAGSVWIHSGKDGRMMHALGGALAGVGFGTQIAAGRDIDGDGRADIAVSRLSHSSDAAPRGNLVALYSGATGELLRVFARDPILDWSALVPAHKLVVLPGRDPTGAIELCPDRDGDRGAELIIATVEDNQNALEADKSKVLYGINVIDPLSGSSFVQFLLDYDRKYRAASVLRSISDIDADGCADFAVTVVDRYISFLSGSTGKQLRFHIWMTMYNQGEGSTLDVLGDVNGDGFVDLVMGANDEDFGCDEGYALIHCGRTSDYVARRFFNEPKDAELGDGRLVRLDCPGADVCALGDFDGDGVNDALVALRRLDQVRILSGRDLTDLKRHTISDIIKGERSGPPLNAPAASSPTDSPSPD